MNWDDCGFVFVGWIRKKKKIGGGFGGKKRVCIIDRWLFLFR